MRPTALLTQRLQQAPSSPDALVSHTVRRSPSSAVVLRRSRSILASSGQRLKGRCHQIGFRDAWCLANTARFAPF
jgi:hypothetical protein